MTAAELKAALYGRHPGGAFPMPGPWTCVEEYRGIDFLAFSAWSSEGGYGRVGYEVKVSRTDFRRELLNPGKRARNVAWCNEFCIAVPKGLLKPEELAYAEPEWDDGDFERSPCPASLRPYTSPRLAPGEYGRCYKGRVSTLLVGPLPEWRQRSLYRPLVEVTCPECGGKSHTGLSRVEVEAPTLWVPRDVGLVEVDGRGCHVVRKAPRRKDVPALGPREVGQLIRWVSLRPDPRHRNLRPQLEQVA